MRDILEISLIVSYGFLTMSSAELSELLDNIRLVILKTAQQYASSAENCLDEARILPDVYVDCGQKKCDKFYIRPAYEHKETADKLQTLTQQCTQTCNKTAYRVRISRKSMRCILRPSFAIGIHIRSLIAITGSRQYFLEATVARNQTRCCSW